MTKMGNSIECNNGDREGERDMPFTTFHNPL